MTYVLRLQVSSSKFNLGGLHPCTCLTSVHLSVQAMTMASLSSTVDLFVNEPLFILSILGGKDKNFKLFAKNCHIKKKSWLIWQTRQRIQIRTKLRFSRWRYLDKFCLRKNTCLNVVQLAFSSRKRRCYRPTQTPCHLCCLDVFLLFLFIRPLFRPC